MKAKLPLNFKEGYYGDAIRTKYDDRHKRKRR